MNHQEGLSIANKLAGAGYHVILDLDNGKRRYAQDEKPSASVTVRPSRDDDLDQLIAMRDKISEVAGTPVNWDGSTFDVEGKLSL